MIGVSRQRGASSTSSAMNSGTCGKATSNSNLHTFFFFYTTFASMGLLRSDQASSKPLWHTYIGLVSLLLTGSTDLAAPNFI